MKRTHAIRVEPGKRVSLDDISTRPPKDIDRDDANAELAELEEELGELQELMWGARQHGVLVVLQGRDTAGKDGAIKRVVGSLNPRGVQVVSFGPPTEEELQHDFLWRVHKHAPRKGEFSIFNRSHYEDVLVVRVHDLVKESVWRPRYEHIVDFETMLSQEGCIVLKFFLHISKDEQRARLLDREKDAAKAWKLNPGDWKERRYWSEYSQAYEDVFKRCSTELAPWHIVPADSKWYRNLSIAQAIVQVLRPHKDEWVDTLTEKGKLGREALKELEKEDRG
ncbi:MAG TPA: PPK2 family polyphosphate kinase [Polyangiaceae bacterium]|jgi:PPK2 family polyphosphate:nucleotide phosphotransferase|nr:PPK2 family polyphosphate kinase [Polyangiaceae bacterium]